MNDLVKAISRFLGRDLPYIIGGVSLILSLEVAFGVRIVRDLSTAHLVFVGAIGYVVGYAVQEFVSLSPIVTTAFRIVPNRFLKWSYRRWSREIELKIDAALDYHALYYRMQSELSPDRLAALERIIVLKTFGTSVGSCWLFSSAALAYAGVHFSSIELAALAGTVFFLAATLILTGWLQSLEMIVVIGKLRAQLPEVPSRSTPT